MPKKIDLPSRINNSSVSEHRSYLTKRLLIFKKADRLNVRLPMN